MPDAQGFTAADLTFCIENLSPDARGRLGWKRIVIKILEHPNSHGWYIWKDDDFYEPLESATYPDHAAICFEVKKTLEEYYGVVVVQWGGPTRYTLAKQDLSEWPRLVMQYLGENLEDVHTFHAAQYESEFTAAASALRKCKEVGK